MDELKLINTNRDHSFLKHPRSGIVQVGEVNGYLMEHWFQRLFSFGDHQFEFVLLLQWSIGAGSQLRFKLIYHRIDSMNGFTYVFVLKLNFHYSFGFEDTSSENRWNFCVKYTYIQICKLIRFVTSRTCDAVITCSRDLRTSLYIRG